MSSQPASPDAINAQIRDLIGQVTIAGANVERALWLYAGLLSGVPFEKLWVLLPDNMSGILHKVEALVRLNVAEEDRPPITAVIGRVRKAWEDRNRVVHGNFGTHNPGGVFVRLNFKPLSRGDLDTDVVEQWSVARLESIVNALRAVSREIGDLVRPLQGPLPS